MSFVEILRILAFDIVTEQNGWAWKIVVLMPTYPSISFMHLATEENANTS